ncbi:hypothetical protein MHM83_06975 [Tenacibaculum sp. Mcav3-52]|uniref:hypothetical protein n=1 Tax=Tenacibaculum sp. Mcav3-52 TaxID=2917762 RepID=UPI001EF3D410|nr:hypothetical protein [Tenacibaculum sp. Mcav3-52]MCG7501609.1 hypothetical protein [Tenacibaculum sp. Mcav3-52]
MTFKQFKISVFLLLVTGVVSAQKYDKKFSENFKTSKDVVVNINASNADVDVTTWNKNEVSVEAVVEVEGLDKKEAQKYLDNWKFEALGNKSKVQINANRNSFRIGRDNIVFFNSSDNNYPRVFEYDTESEVVVIPEIPEVSIPEMPEMPEMPEIEIPEINFEKLFQDVDFDVEEMFENEELVRFKWKDGKHNVNITSKEEWEEFKKTEAYKEYLKNNKNSKTKMFFSKNHQVLNEKKLRDELKRVKSELKKIDREKIQKQLAKVKVEMHKVREEMKKNHRNYSFSSGSNNLMINGKKVKITKKITIKVPKSATFDLNTRHCKVKLPKTKASGKVSYGTFKADALDGGKLNISFSPVNINSLNACTLFLNNVTDAQLASVTNTTVNSNSSGLVVNNVYSNVEVNNKFGNLTITKVHPSHDNLKVLLSYSDAGVDLAGINKKFDIQSNKVKKLKDGSVEYNGEFILISNDKKIEIDGKYSQLKVKNQ